MLKKCRVRRGCTVPSPLTWPPLRNPITQKLATTGSVDGCSVLPEAQFFGIRQRVDITWVLSVGGSLPRWNLLERGHSLTPNRHYGLHSCFFLEVTSLSLFHKAILPQDSGDLKVVFHLLGELPRSMEPHLPACQLCRRQLGPTKLLLLLARLINSQDVVFDE